MKLGPWYLQLKTGVVERMVLLWLELDELGNDAGLDIGVALRGGRRFGGCEAVSMIGLEFFASAAKRPLASW